MMLVEGYLRFHGKSYVYLNLKVDWVSKIYIFLTKICLQSKGGDRLSIPILSVLKFLSLGSFLLQIF